MGVLANATLADGTCGTSLIGKPLAQEYARQAALPEP